MKTSLDSLVDVDREIGACNAEIDKLHAQYIAPVERRRAEAGARANELWLDVLKQYGPGEAQRRLREAKKATL